MNKHLWLIVFMLWMGEGGWHGIEPVVVLEGDVVMGNVLPDWGTVCVDSVIRGGPDEMYAERYSVSVGQVVRLHEPSKPYGAWVSIGVAQWMPLDNLCWKGQ